MWEGLRCLSNGGVEKEEVSDEVKVKMILPEVFVEGESLVREVARGVAVKDSVEEEKVSGGEIMTEE